MNLIKRIESGILDNPTEFTIAVNLIKRIERECGAEEEWRDP